MRYLPSIAIVFLPLVALAAYDTAHLPYTDAPGDRVTAVAVSLLTEEGILQGYPDGTFRPDQPVNRAEFLKLAMRASAAEVIPPVDTACFPDIDPAAWYASFVCAAKRDGLIAGDALDGIDASQWRFHPSRTVNYAEAAKILMRTFGIAELPVKANVWYAPFLATAEAEGIELPGVHPSDALTRGEVAQLAASFLAWDRGELAQLRAAQEGRAFSSASSVSCDPFVCPDGTSQPSCTSDGHPIAYFADPCLTHQVRSSSSSSVSSASSLSSASSVSYDPGPDFSQRASFLRLGTTSPILGAAKIFNNSEPFTVDDISVTFTGTVPSVDQVRLYATADGRYLGGASRNSDDPSTFTLHIASGILSVARRIEVSVYARVITRGFDQGGESGEAVQIDHFFIEGRGDWSTRRYNQSTTDTYQTFETARSTFAEITNAGPTEDALVGGIGRTIGQWRLAGVRGDGSADLKVTDAVFSLGVSGGVTLANVTLGADGSSDRSDCVVSGDAITCAAISESVGTVAGATRILTLRGDITVPASSQSAGLQISLTPAGSAASAGALTWTDGTTSFSWVPFDESQLRGTFYRF
ncbi:MAG: S-layer homology domain-containing protein [Candidatus Peribacteraceae bacterium]|nr:S-layer homology domain-containing protein [Candidatus Peribacteraceae bacterium]MDD5742910.1 S-layer homology domain-containing protein [Candidatus Peribacteraceae bacterium]